MSEECVHYLLQIQSQWETLKREAGEEGEAMALKKSASSNGSVEREENYGKYGHYVPPGGTEAIGELLNSRYMVSRIDYSLCRSRTDSLRRRSFHSPFPLRQKCSSTLVETSLVPSHDHSRPTVPSNRNPQP